MEHVAIDLGGRESQLCVRNERGEILVERRVTTRSLEKHLRKRPKSVVVMETCAEAFSVADAAAALGHEVRVVPATLVRALGVGARGIKTDVRDARVLSEASVRMTLPSVHVPSLASRDGKALCNARDVLVKCRTMLINAQRGYLRTQTVKVAPGGSETFPARVAKALRKAQGEPPPAQSSSAPQDTTSATVDRNKYPSALSASGALPVFADRLLCAIGELTERIAQADEELKQRVAPDPVCQRLMSIPGVGPVCATRFVTTLDTVERFASTAQVQSYLGLVPGEQQSGDKRRQTRMIKCGAAPARAALVQSAWCLYRLRKNDPLVLWATELEKRRGKKIAISSLARKLATVMFVLWRDGTTYEPSRVLRNASKREEATATS